MTDLAIVASGLLIAVAAVTAFATWQQAQESKRIADLTRELARVAQDALEASRREAGAAEAAVNQSRQQQRLASTTVLSVEGRPEPYRETGDQPPGMKLTVRNAGNVPMLSVAGRVFSTGGPGLAVEGPYAQSEPLPVLGGGDSARLNIKLNDLRNVPTAGSPSNAFFARDWLVVEVSGRGMLGATVATRYDWEANKQAAGQKPSYWRLREVLIDSHES